LVADLLALKGHKSIAGGNAPGKLKKCSPTLKGSYNPRPENQKRAGGHLKSTLSGSAVVGVGFPGALPPAIEFIPLRGSRLDGADHFFRSLFSP
jgi:hypothetical protein